MRFFKSHVLKKIYIQVFIILIPVMLFFFDQTLAQHFVWGQSFSANAYGGADAYSIAVGKDESVFVAGSYNVELNIAGHILKSNGGTDGFIVKLDSAGSALWYKSMYATGYVVFKSIGTDEQGGLYAGGSFFDTLFIQSDTIIGISGYENGILTRYSDTGDLLWYKYLPGYFLQHLALDRDGNVYVLGFEFSPNLTVSIIEFDRYGVMIFKSIISVRTDISFFLSANIAIDPWENIYISGLGSNALIGDIHYTSGQYGSFVLIKCDPGGKPKWVKTVEDIPSSGSWYECAIVCDGQGNVYYSTFADELSLSRV